MLPERHSPISSSAPPSARNRFGDTPAFVPFAREEIEQSISQRFEQQVARQPDRLAVKTRAESLTYAVLNERANQVARALLAEGATTAEPVILLVEPVAWQVATILGILKVGRPYVPLDPRYPLPRLSYMVEDSQATVIVTDHANRGLARRLATHGQQVICLEEITAPARRGDPGVAVPPTTPACIFYTSGSTGQPKGVVNNHRNVLHNILRYTNALRIHADDRLTLLQSCSFSGSVSSLFSAVLNGACLFPYDVREEGVHGLAAWVSGAAITIYHSVPSLFRELFHGREQFPHLRVVRLEGDQASLRDVELFRGRLAPHCILANGLGTTETGLACQYLLGRERVALGTTVPVGYSLPGMEVLVLDEAARLVEPGQVGEIAVRSRYLAVGYWRRPDLTAAAFGTEPVGSPARLYRTGDLGRMQADGCVEYLGRKDFQPKVRGQRIHVESVEAALACLDAVREAVVQVREDHPGDPQVVAYIVPSGPQAPTVSALRRSIDSSLPAAMLPAHFVFLMALPLNDNGKVDRRALPPPTTERPALDTVFVPARTPVEARLAEIWSDLLGVQGVGVHDDFFELGGHSLLATQILNRVRQEFGVELTLGGLLEEPTVAGLGVAVVRQLAETLPPAELAHFFALTGPRT